MFDVRHRSLSRCRYGENQGGPHHREFLNEKRAPRSSDFRTHHVGPYTEIGVDRSLLNTFPNQPERLLQRLLFTREHPKDPSSILPSADFDSIVALLVEFNVSFNQTHPTQGFKFDIRPFRLVHLENSLHHACDLSIDMS